MPITYNPVTSEELDRLVSMLSASVTQLKAASDAMKQQSLTEVWLPWTDSTRRYVSVVSSIGAQAISEVALQSADHQQGLQNRHEKQKARSARDVAVRKARQAEARKPQVSRKSSAK